MSLVNCILIDVSQDCFDLVSSSNTNILGAVVLLCKCLSVQLWFIRAGDVGMFVANLSLLGDLIFYLAFSCVFL